LSKGLSGGESFCRKARDPDVSVVSALTSRPACLDTSQEMLRECSTERSEDSLGTRLIRFVHELRHLQNVGVFATNVQNHPTPLGGIDFIVKRWLEIGVKRSREKIEAIPAIAPVDRLVGLQEHRWFFAKPNACGPIACLLASSICPVANLRRSGKELEPGGPWTRTHWSILSFVVRALDRLHQ